MITRDRLLYPGLVMTSGDDEDGYLYPGLVMTSGDQEEQIFRSQPHTHDEFL